MKTEQEENQSKGLFTFYKEQQAYQDMLKLKFKKNGKKKKKKSKRKIQSQMKAFQNSVLVIKQQCQENLSTCNPQEAYDHFMKNLNLNKNKKLTESENSKSGIQRTKTEPTDSLNKLIEEKTLKISKKATLINQLSKKYNFLPSKQHILSSSNLQRLNIQRRTPITLTRGSKIKQQTQQNEDSKAKSNEKESFLLRLQSLSIKNNKSNLISSSQNIKLKDLVTSNEGKYNLAFFNDIKQLGEDSSAYRELKDAFILPQIRRQRFQLQIKSPRAPFHKLGLASKNMPYQRRDIRLKHSNERRRQFYKMNLIAQLSQSKNLTNSPTISLIDMSKICQSEGQNSHDKQLRFRAIKSRIGMQI